jgi:hypothetical protein
MRVRKAMHGHGSRRAGRIAGLAVALLVAGTLGLLYIALSGRG